MIQKLNEKYAALKALSFGNRSDDEIDKALERPTMPDDAVERDVLWANLEPGFVQDAEAITSSANYKRLAHMGQLAPSFSHAFQTRMTHTTHVARVAQKMCKAMHLDSDSIELAQAIACAHDIGHAPFSHEAEELFNEILGEGNKWDHDYYGMRVLTDRAQGMLRSDGLPLTTATLEGTLKRYRCFTGDDEKLDTYHAPIKDVPRTIQSLEDEGQYFHLKEWSPIEGQIVSISDWIAGTCSDMRDLLLWELEGAKGDMSVFHQRAKKILADFPIAPERWPQVQTLISEEDKGNPDQQTKAVRLLAKIVEKELMTDVLDTTLAHYEAHKSEIENAEDVRKLEDPLVSFSPELMEKMLELKESHQEALYPKILQQHLNTKDLMQAFFELAEVSFQGEEKLEVADDWMQLYNGIQQSDMEDNSKETIQKYLVIDYITSNFTDQDVMYLLKTHAPEKYDLLTQDILEAAYPQQPAPSSAFWAQFADIAGRAGNKVGKIIS